MNKLYYITGYRFEPNEWWRYAVSGEDRVHAINRFMMGFSDTHFTRINCVEVCATPEDVFVELG